jgi:DNA-binding CsgD family transcriptional regulator
MDKQLIQSRDYENILQFISLIRQDKGDYRSRVLKSLSDVFTYNNVTFLLVDEKGMFTDPLSLNISRNLCHMYTQYYFKTDIFHPINIPPQLMLTKKTITVSDLMTYRQFENTDYYNDFLKKDNLYYEVALPLIKGNKLIGGVGIFRPKEEGNFSRKDMEILAYLSNHIAYYLDQYQEAFQIKNENFIYKNCMYESPIGLVILDSDQSLISFNEAAEVFCMDILNHKACSRAVEEVVNMVMSNLDLGGINSGSCIYADLQQYTFKISLSIAPDIHKGVKVYYHIYIVKDLAKRKTDLSYLLQVYKLTQRELEVIELISKGLSNREISEKLYISINTVRTHIDNIFSKLNVGSRMALINKIGII